MQFEIKGGHFLRVAIAIVVSLAAASVGVGICGPGLVGVALT